MLLGVLTGETIGATLGGLLFVGLGVLMLRWRREVIRFMQAAQDRFQTPGGRFDQAPWSAVMVGVIWVVIGGLAAVAGMTNGFGSWD